MQKKRWIFTLPLSPSFPKTPPPSTLSSSSYQSTQQSLDPYLREKLQATSTTEPESNTMVNEENNMFMDRLKKVIDENMSNSDLSVEIIGAEMGLSRVQLYRRTKAACGLSPNETLRTQRLNKAYKLLHETQKTISEVAYEVGFSSPSYFAQCYKDYFGKNPTESLRN